MGPDSGSVSKSLGDCSQLLVRGSCLVERGEEVVSELSPGDTAFEREDCDDETEEPEEEEAANPRA